MDDKVKKNIFKIVIIAIILAITITALLLIFPPQTQSDKDGFLIACILTLTGPGESMGYDIQDGLLLAAKEINAWGGINGKPVRLIIKDSGSSPEQAADVFREIESEQKPLLYISNMSSVALALAPLAKEYEVTLMGLITTTEKLTVQNKWSFKYWADAESEAKPILEIISMLGIENLGILYSNDEYGNSVFNRIIIKYNSSGGTSENYNFPTQTIDFTGYIEKLNNTECILLIGYPLHAINIIPQLRESEYAGEIIITNSASHPDIRSIPESDGIYIPAPLVYKNDFLFAKEQKDIFEVEYRRPFNHFAANSYDFIKILAFILGGKSINRITIRDELESGFVFPGIFGEIKVERGSRDFSFYNYPAKIENGEIIFLEY